MLTIHYEPDAAEAATHLTKRLTRELQSDQQDDDADTGTAKNVVWLVSGGSNIALSLQVIRALPQEHMDRLTIMLSDERYGKPGHADSNWQQLADIGFEAAAEAAGAKFLATLQPDMTLDDTCEHYGRVVCEVFDQADVIIAQLGIGGDGHIAGILPRSTAVGSEDQVAGYDSGPYQRITMTPATLLRVTAAYAFAYGDTKHQALRRLESQDLSISEEPAQILKQISESHLFTDQRLRA